jgi:dihydropteroate synthase
MSINTLLLNKKTHIMGIVNLTTHSFCSVGRYPSTQAAIDYALGLIDEGADIIDLGAEATNPAVGLKLDTAHELEKLLPVIEGLRVKTRVPISVDTSDPLVMQAVIDSGADMINDVRALRVDGALEVVAKLQVPVCLMHMRYPFGFVEPVTEQSNIVEDVMNFFLVSLAQCLRAGILKENIIIDIGLGGGHFGKDAQENIELIRAIPQFLQLGYPLLVGASFKSFMGELLNLPAEERSIPSLTTAIYAALMGAKILRVHEVKKTRQALDMLSYFV